jgi:hypothetical protein
MDDMKKMWRYVFAIGAFATVLFATPTLAFARGFDRDFTNASLDTKTQPKPVGVSDRSHAADAVALENGDSLRIFRRNINGVALWRFSLDDAYWWVTDKGVIYGKGTAKAGSAAALEAGNDEEAYRRYLSMEQGS